MTQREESGSDPWEPTALVEVIESVDSSTGATRVKTDATFAFLKVMGNRSGPHRLACDWVGSKLARWFGLATPDIAILTLGADDTFPLPRKHLALPGPAFASRFVPGHTWGGDAAELRLLVNREDISRLVVFDTWILNRDRHPPDPATRKPNHDNVYLADTVRANRWRLLAIDHTHAFTGEDSLGARLAHISSIKDERTYGLFPEFIPFLDAGELHWAKSFLSGVNRGHVESVVSSIPEAWDVDRGARTALIELIVCRAAFLVDRIEQGWPSRVGTTPS